MIFGEITFTFRGNRGFRGFWNFFFLLLVGFGTPWVGGSHRGFRKYLIYVVCFPEIKRAPAYEQTQVDLATFRAVKTSTWGHCPQVLVFTIVWDTPGKEKVAKWSSAPASILEDFNEIEGQKTLQNWVTNTILPNRPVFTLAKASALYRGQNPQNREKRVSG